MRLLVEICGFSWSHCLWRFVEGFSSIVSPLTVLTQKKAKCLWSEICEKSFQELKDRLFSAPVLILPEGSNEFVVYCAASRIGLEGVRLVDSNESVVVVHNDSKLSFMPDVKVKQGLDSILVELNEALLKKSVEAFSQRGDAVFQYQGRFELEPPAAHHLRIPFFPTKPYSGEPTKTLASSSIKTHHQITKTSSETTLITAANKLTSSASEFRRIEAQRCHNATTSQQTTTTQNTTQNPFVFSTATSSSDPQIHRHKTSNNRHHLPQGPTLPPPKLTQTVPKPG
ncbi:hypothetical protein MTR67_048526 [Solanum verrucosum]|uniref:Reverse transcriptase/retrotransposon-derived protein RNase H-like domain-containing protein n=1 Tax=Solanum verrucosum TaxID=315347 RepID=A0AAF0ZXH0_SOLVR|nr:hypothetical protein MTR67_048526 [Solanum verrucosum]